MRWVSCGTVARADCRKPLITSHFPLHPPSYPSVHIDTYNHALKRARAENEDLEPVIWVQTMVKGGGMAGAGLCHLEREGLRYLVPVGQEGESTSQSLSLTYSQSPLCILILGSFLGYINRLSGRGHGDDYQGQF